MPCIPESSKVAIIGAGSVGSTIAYALILRNLNVDILLADVNTKSCQGQVKDLEDSAFYSRTHIRYADISETGSADIIIVTAGAKQKPNESRDELVGRNRDIMSSIIETMGTINPDAIWLVVANPVEILTGLAQKLTKLPHKQVLGTGTFLDTQRLRTKLADILDMNANSIHCNIIGEHGDKQVVAWSNSTLSGGLPLLNHPKISALSKQDLDKMEHEVSRRAYDIIDLKGSTHYGIGYCVSILCDAMLSDSKTVYPVACYHPKYEAYISYPAILSRKGVLSHVQDIVFNSEEQKRLDAIAENIRKCNI